LWFICAGRRQSQLKLLQDIGGEHAARTFTANITSLSSARALSNGMLPPYQPSSGVSCEWLAKLDVILLWITVVFSFVILDASSKQNVS
jgi:hypothetical protein